MSSEGYKLEPVEGHRYDVAPVKPTAEIWA